MELPMRVDKERRHLPDKAYPNEIAYFFASWVCKNKDGQWWVHFTKPILNEKEGKWISPDPFDDLDIPEEHIIDPGRKWNEGIWDGSK